MLDVGQVPAHLVDALLLVLGVVRNVVVVTGPVATGTLTEPLGPPVSFAIWLASVRSLRSFAPFLGLCSLRIPAKWLRSICRSRVAPRAICPSAGRDLVVEGSARGSLAVRGRLRRVARLPVSLAGLRPCRACPFGRLLGPRGASRGAVVATSRHQRGRAITPGLNLDAATPMDKAKLYREQTELARHVTHPVPPRTGVKRTRIHQPKFRGPPRHIPPVPRCARASSIVRNPSSQGHGAANLRVWLR